MTDSELARAFRKAEKRLSDLFNHPETISQLREDLKFEFRLQRDRICERWLRQVEGDKTDG